MSVGPRLKIRDVFTDYWVSKSRKSLDRVRFTAVVLHLKSGKRVRVTKHNGYSLPHLRGTYRNHVIKYWTISKHSAGRFKGDHSYFYRYSKGPSILKKRTLHVYLA